MLDAHFHRDVYETFLEQGTREFRFFGIHPWRTVEEPEAVESRWAAVRTAVAEDPHAGVGEIGLDRLRTKTIPDVQRALFERQLALAAEFGRPVVLHGAKCWGEVVKACSSARGRIPAFLFHGFSRSEGLLPEIFALNGFVSVGPALLNDHAVNYRELARKLPEDRMLVETDAAEDGTARTETIAAILRRLAELRAVPVAALEARIGANLAAFTEALA